ncbi:Histone-lysine N-methyltransferase, H3 lysine-36 specific, partial [Tetrabaena socialis]
HIALYSRKAFEAGDLLIEFGASAEQDHPTYLTLQVGEGRHIELRPEWLEHVNHSCDPNALFDTTTFRFEAIRSIAPGDELSFFYPSTEWSMGSPFKCKCGSPACVGVIAGASQLGAAVLAGRRLTDFIAAKLRLLDAPAGAAPAAADGGAAAGAGAIMV